MALSVRSLTETEGNRLLHIMRHSRNAVAVRRAQVLIMSDQGSTVQEIAQQTLMHEEYVRELIRRFNAEGLALLRERPKTGRPVEFMEELQAEIVQVALAPPKLLGRPFTVWSLEKLREYLIATKVVKTISIETLRTILHSHGAKLQRTKTWKESNDPAFAVKKNG
jgi:transposase